MDDLISRQAAIEVIDAVMPVDPNKSEYASGIACGAALAMTYVKQLPSAQPERKRGEWTETKEWGGRNYSCSCCKFSFMVDTCMLKPMWNYCPNCGAEMQKGEDDE